MMHRFRFKDLLRSVRSVIREDGNIALLDIYDMAAGDGVNWTDLDRITDAVIDACSLIRDYDAPAGDMYYAREREIFA
jgi:hypothetical protein